MIRPPPRSTLFPSTTLFRSLDAAGDEHLPLARLDRLRRARRGLEPGAAQPVHRLARDLDRKSTRLNSSHQIISYAVFCLKKKKQTQDAVAPRIDELTRAASL